MTRPRLFCVGLLLSGLAACSPTHDWRQVRMEGGLQGLLPCRPARQARSVPLGTLTVQMNLAACEAGGETWALSASDVGHVGAVGAALAQLRQAAATNIRASEADVTRGEVVVRGMTPHAGSGRLIIGGEMPDGRKVNLLVVLFSRGSWVFQATVLGEVLPPEGVETFLGGLQVVP